MGTASISYSVDHNSSNQLALCFPFHSGRAGAFSSWSVLLQSRAGIPGPLVPVPVCFYRAWAGISNVNLVYKVFPACLLCCFVYKPFISL